jgi:hypothetical protein
VTREFEDLVELAGVAPDEQARLRRVHGLLVAAGPPAELPAALLRPPELGGAEVVRLAQRRRPVAALLIAAAVAIVCFGSGYLLANQAHPGTTAVARVVTLQGAGQHDAFASLRVGSADSDGNWPMQLTVSGLPALASAQSRYFLMLWEDGKPSSLCGIFKVGRDGSATVSFSVPYAINRSTRFVVTEMAPGSQFPGHVVMTSS